MGENMQIVLFSQLDLNDTFFDSLREDYNGFEDWFLKKKDQKAYVHYDGNDCLDGFLYLKIEEDQVIDIQPTIFGEKIAKIGTFKIKPHGTRLGERFIKKALDFAVTEKALKCYVTVFEKQTALIRLFEKYGFKKYGRKGPVGLEELVLLKELNNITGNIFYDYPLIHIEKKRKFLLSIYPKYHSIMFPDSILNNESNTILSDVSYTNSIHKTYVCRMSGVENLKYGDLLVVYRTAEEGKSAEYSSVVSSICVVESVKRQNDFNDFEEFYEYVCTYSVFERKDLERWYNVGGCVIIKMTYNIALKKRITRHNLIESMGFSRIKYWGFMSIDDEKFNKIIEVGEANESIIIN